MLKYLAANTPNDVHTDIKLSLINWWTFTVVLLIVMVVYGLVRSVWTPLFEALGVIILFVLFNAVLNHKKSFVGASAQDPHNFKVVLYFSDTNWWVCMVVLFMVYIITAGRNSKDKAGFVPAVLMLLLALLYGLLLGR